MSSPTLNLKPEKGILQSSSPTLKFSDYHPTHVDLKTTQNRHGGKRTKLRNALLETLPTKLSQLPSAFDF